MKRTVITFIVTLIAAASGAYGGGSGGSYPYLGKTFKMFVQDSYSEGHKGSPEQFYKWFRAAFAKSAPVYKGLNESDLPRFLSAEKIRIDAIKDTKAKVTEELRLGEYLHKLIKRTIRTFSLDRGFEFHAAEKLGERQCLLQAVLIAGLLQQMDIKAGVIMVYRNKQGEYSFNGHVTTLMRLSDGKDIMIDASDQVPFAKHQGILAQTAKYCYLGPVYAKNSARIVGYRNNSGKQIKPSSVTPLDVNYVRSLFYYYRGERAPGGVIASARTKKGLAASAYFLGKSVKLSPTNSLAVYMLGRTYSLQGKYNSATAQYRKALNLQQSFGWVPPSIPEALSGRTPHS